MRDPRWTRLAEAGIFAELSPDSWIDGVIDLVLHDPAAGELWIVDWKTNRRREGEDDKSLLRRLAAEYAGQLAAYGTSAAAFFPGSAVRLWVYSTVAGAWTRVDAPARAAQPGRIRGKIALDSPRRESHVCCTNSIWETSRRNAASR